MHPRPPTAGSAGLISVLVVLGLTAAGSAYVVLMPDAPGAATASATFPTQPSRVGVSPYDGPITGTEVLAACQITLAKVACWSTTLGALLEGKGAGAAFDALEQMAASDRNVEIEGHALAHGLGRLAFDAYGSIALALQECSYKLFGGCHHGALQNYFDSLGRSVGAQDIDDLCPSEPRFAEYTCLHGLGHGLMLNSNYDLNGSLRLCDTLDGWYAESSCLGGAFMENWVGYVDSLTPTAAGGHEHDHGGPEPTFWIRADDPQYPCSIVASKYQSDCWLLQTSIVLHFNRGDFPATAAICAGLEDGRTACFRSYGRDVSPHVARDVPRAEQLCRAEPTGADDCIRGVVTEITLNAAQPAPGFAACALVGDDLKPGCYHELGWQVAGMVGRSEAQRLCDGAVDGFKDDCIRGSEL